MPGVEVPQLVVQRCLQGFQLTQTVYVAARLGIADLLADGALTSTELAAATDTEPTSLRRLLSALTAAGLLTEDAEDRFALTEAGELLRTGVPGSARNRALFFGDLLHSPYQVTDPLCNSMFCLDQDQARATRLRVLGRAADERELVVPAHFGGHGAAEVRHAGNGFAIAGWAGFAQP